MVYYELISITTELTKVAIFRL